MNSTHFYRDLTPLTAFEQAPLWHLHTDIPEDWFVIITDVVNSTKAIQSGKYKDINTVGASAIIAVLNIDRSIEIPYVFGGDGATLAVPASIEHKSRQALLEAKKMAHEGFGLELRVGMFCVSDLLKKDYRFRVAKYPMSKNFSQPVFSGRGFEAAERLLKDPLTQPEYEVVVTENLQPFGSFEGMECRWQPVKSHLDRKLAVVILCLDRDVEVNSRCYQQVMAEIRKIFGQGVSLNPISKDALSLSLDPRRLAGEAIVKNFQHGQLKKILYIAKSWLLNLTGKYLLRSNIGTKKVGWKQYMDDFVDNTDYRKFDGAFKLVIDSSLEQMRTFNEYLENRFQNRELVYGIHASKDAILTCLVFSYNGRHIHFVDGADGGYALAAKAMKEQLRQVKQTI